MKQDFQKYEEFWATSLTLYYTNSDILKKVVPDMKIEIKKMLESILGTI